MLARIIHRKLKLATGAGLAAAAVCSTLAVAAPPASAAVAPIGHIWVINLENRQICVNPANQPINAVDPNAEVGCPLPSDVKAGPYLGAVLPAEGTLLANYYGIGHNSLDNYIAEVSGQAPNPQTQGDCLAAQDVTPGVLGAQGQAIGVGCTYPSPVKTIADQLDPNHQDLAGTTWKGYEEDMGNNLATEQKRDCVASTDGSYNIDDSYLPKHDPFVWFHSLIDDQRYCDAHVIPLSGLPRDLQRVSTTPRLSFITPNMADDGHDSLNLFGDPSAWAARWVRMIMASPAYRQDGMIAIIYDENDGANTVGAAGPIQGVRASCCGEIPGPSSPSPGALDPRMGGGETGAWVITPYTTPGTILGEGSGPSDQSGVDLPSSYNHYSLLRTIEDLLGVSTGGADGLGHLGYAAGNGGPNSTPAYTFRSFGCDDIFTVACPPAGMAVPAATATALSTNVGPRATDGTVRWLNPGPQGNDLTAVSCADASDCVAVGATGAIVRTGDGTRWTSVPSGTSTDLGGVSCAAGSSHCVAVGNGGLVLTSDDLGQSCTAASSGTASHLSSVARPTASACHAIGAGGTILATNDGGATWNAQNSSSKRDLVQIACPTATTCYVTGDYGTSPGSPSADVLATADGGRSWAVAPATHSEQLLAVACSDSTHCVAGDDGGASSTTGDGFATLAAGGGPAGGRLTAGSCAASTCTLVGGAGWTVSVVAGKVATPVVLPSYTNLAGVSCPVASTCFAVGAQGAIFASHDGGQSWAREGANRAASDYRDHMGGNYYTKMQGGTIGSLNLASVACASPSTCAVAGAGGAILTTADGGSAFTPRAGGGVAEGTPFNAPLTADPNSGPYAAGSFPESAVGDPVDAVSCSSPSACVGVGELDKVLTTSDLDHGGGDWTPQLLSAKSSGIKYTGSLTGVSCPAGTSTCFAVGDYGTIVKSIDGGSTWSALSSPTKTFLNSVSCTSATACVAVGSQGTILITSDGANWLSISSPTSQYLSSVSCNGQSCLSVGSAGTVIGSDDGGQSWTPRTAPSGDDLYAVSCPQPGECVATGSAGTVASTGDGGQSWNLQGSGTTDALRAVQCPTRSKCLAAGDNGAILAIDPTPPAAAATHPGGASQQTGATGTTITAPVETAGAVGARTAAGSRCPLPSGDLTGATLGPVRLGGPRGTTARGEASRGLATVCLDGGPIRVAYGGGALLRGLPANEQTALAGRIVLATTANAHYAYRGVHPGAPVAAIAQRLHLGRAIRLAANSWYLIPGGAATGLLEARHGVIVSIGIALPRITATRARATRLLATAA